MRKHVRCGVRPVPREEKRKHSAAGTGGPERSTAEPALCDCRGCARYQKTRWIDSPLWFCSYSEETGRLRGISPRDCYRRAGTPYRAAGDRGARTPLPRIPPETLAAIRAFVRLGGRLPDGIKERAETAAACVGLDARVADPEIRARLLCAIRDHLTDLRGKSCAVLRIEYALPLSVRAFSRETRLYCASLAEACGLAQAKNAAGKQADTADFSLSSRHGILSGYSTSCPRGSAAGQGAEGDERPDP